MGGWRFPLCFLIVNPQQTPLVSQCAKIRLGETCALLTALWIGLGKTCQTTGGKDKVMKNNQKNVTVASNATVGNAAPSNVTAIAPVRGAPVNRFKLIQTEQSKLAEAKAAMLGTVRQQLAEAADLFKAGLGTTNEGRETAAKAALGLFQLRRDGRMSQEELTALLGDQFGFKTKKDGTPSKTPSGEGENIRKRVTRAAQAAEYVASGGTEGTRFYDGLPVNEVESVLNRIGAETDGLSIFSAYDSLGDIKSDATDPIEAAFNPKTVMRLYNKLSEAGSGDIVRSSELLMTAYAALMDVLNVIAEQPDAVEAA